MSELRRVVRLRTVVSTSAGLTFATSCFVAAVQVANLFAGDASWIAILTAGLLSLLAASCFGELSGLFPTAAALRQYMREGISDRFSLALSLLYVFVVVAVLGAETYVLSEALAASIPGIPSLYWIFALLAVAVLVNLRGITIAGAFQDLVTYGLVLSLWVAALLVLHRHGFALHAPLAVGSFDSFLGAVAVGVFLFVGFEWVTPLAEEVTNFRLIRRGMFLAVGLLSVTYAVFTVAMTSSVPRQLLAATAAPQILFGRQTLGRVGVAWMLALSLAASVTTFNAGFTTGSRFLYACAREGVLPRILTRVSLRTVTPWVAVLAISAVTAVSTVLVYLSGRPQVLVVTGAAMESLIYAVAAVCVLTLRRRRPELKRPYLVPGGPTIPVLTAAVFGVLALGSVAQSPAAGAYLAGGFALAWVYAARVAPFLKRQYAARRGPTARRRPGRPPSQETPVP